MMRFKKLFLSFSENYHMYFHEERDQIAQQNLRLLKHLSLITAGLLLFFFLFTPLVLPHWTITKYHIFFLPASLLFWFISVIYERNRWSLRFVPVMCVLFQVLLFSFILLIDLLAAPDTPASFMPGLCISLPVLFVMSFQCSYGIMIVFEVLYILCAITFKDPFLAQYDIFNSVVGIAFSIAVAEVTMRLRLRNYAIQMKYKQLSTVDTLSGILNKRAWTESVKQYLWLQKSNTGCTMAILDVDDFKQINDQLGHFAGDQILQHIGTVLAETFRATDLVGRFGGDEFVVLLKGITETAVLEKKFQRIEKQLSHIAVGEQIIKVTCSIGIAAAVGESIEFDALFQATDAALYHAKAKGKNNIFISSCKKN